MYRNLLAEIHRQSNEKEFAQSIGWDVAKLSQKLNGKRKFNIDEMYLIQSHIKGNNSLDYLFERETNDID